MNSDQVKSEIIELAQKIKDHTISEEELVEFFNKHRVIFMNTPNVYTMPKDEEEKIESKFGSTNPFEPNIYTKKFPFAMLSCSCGSRSDSCEEDGTGFYSQFYLNDLGDILRIKIQK